ncbi:hypothetical protein Lepto7375DRAFT_5422 [Leptolyngbya sp. PCC 7375]|nr:hypothetical protein Lepto7375DRAFT_5422 [Leptolyngbya sp. PCC 7375]
MGEIFNKVHLRFLINWLQFLIYEKRSLTRTL